MIQPFDEEQWEAFGAVVQNLTQKHEIAPQEYEDMNFTHWAMQSYSLAPEIYKGKLFLHFYARSLNGV